jgi:hypothetical protein
MSRNLFLRVVLSLLLLVSQQSALSHAMSHWTGGDQTEQAQSGSKRTASKGSVHDANCAQCLSYAQMASAIGSPAYVMPALDLAAVHLVSPIPASDCARTDCVFQSRAPPQA